MPYALDARLTSHGDAGFSRFLRRALLASSGLDGDDEGNSSSKALRALGDLVDAGPTRTNVNDLVVMVFD